MQIEWEDLHDNPWTNTGYKPVTWGVDDLTSAEWIAYTEMREDPERLTIISCRGCDIFDHYHPSGYCKECRQAVNYVEPLLIQEEP